MDTLFETAVKAYKKYCDKHLLIFREPNENASETGRKYVHLKNTYEDLARYDIVTGKILVP